MSATQLDSPLLSNCVMKLRTQVAQLIRELRQESGVKQKELALKVHCSPSLISALERGEKSISLDNIELIAEALGLDVVITITSKYSVRSFKTSQTLTGIETNV